MNAKVIPITATRGLHVSLDELVGFEGVKLLAKLIQQWHRADKSRKLKDLARLANLTPTTVSRIMSRETRSPRMLTCIMLFKALGFTAVRFE
jgi:hypothetical protein